MNTCANCGGPVSAGGTCHQCGGGPRIGPPSHDTTADTAFPSCPKCGAELPDFDGWDCKKCGHSLARKARKMVPRVVDREDIERELGIKLGD